MQGKLINNKKKLKELKRCANEGQICRFLVETRWKPKLRNITSNLRNRKTTKLDRRKTKRNKKGVMFGRASSKSKQSLETKNHSKKIQSTETRREKQGSEAQHYSLQHRQQQLHSNVR